MSSSASASSNSSTDIQKIIKQNKSINLFYTQYLNYCKYYKTQPLRLLKFNALNASIEIFGDRIKFEDWIPLLKAISEDTNLHSITLRSRQNPGVVSILEDIDTEIKARGTGRKMFVLFTKYMIMKVIESISQCIINTKALMCLTFDTIPLSYEAMETLTEALSYTSSLQHISFHNCYIGNEGCKLILNVLRNKPSVISLDVSNCNVSVKGASYIADLIKAQEIARFVESWKHSLRYREVSHEILPGLRRINLNDNPDIGDEGLESLLLVLSDDYWIKAVDMQNCGITDEGCASIIKLIKINHEIRVFDIRRNPIQDPNKLVEVLRLLISHCKPDEWEDYGWLQLGSSVPSSSASSSKSSGSQSPPYKIYSYNVQNGEKNLNKTNSMTFISGAKKILYAAINRPQDILFMNKNKSVKNNSSEEEKARTCISVEVLKNANRGREFCNYHHSCSTLNSNRDVNCKWGPAKILRK